MCVCMFVCAYICRTGNNIPEEEEEEEEASNALQTDNPDDAELDSDLEMSSVLESGANDSIIDIALNNEVSFSVEEEFKFAQWFEEQYDLPNSRYDSWLKINHPNACVTEVPDSVPGTPILFSESDSSDRSLCASPVNYLVVSSSPPVPSTLSSTSSGPPSSSSPPVSSTVISTSSGPPSSSSPPVSSTVISTSSGPPSSSSPPVSSTVISTSSGPPSFSNPPVLSTVISTSSSPPSFSSPQVNSTVTSTVISSCWPQTTSFSSFPVTSTYSSPPSVTSPSSCSSQANTSRVSGISPNTSSHSSTSCNLLGRTSPLSSFLTLPTSSGSSKLKKTGKARVLTSDECLKTLKEKERKKQEEAENKEKRRLENLEKKRLKEVEKKRKSEELANKRAERKAVKEAKEMEKAAKKASKEKAKSATDTVATRCSVMVENEDTRRGSKRQAQDIVSSRRTKKNKIDSTVFSDICCVCLGNYDDDADTDRQWLQCKSDRWIHEDCIDYEDSSSSDRLCPLC